MMPAQFRDSSTLQRIGHKSGQKLEKCENELSSYCLSGTDVPDRATILRLRAFDATSVHSRCVTLHPSQLICLLQQIQVNCTRCMIKAASWPGSSPRLAWSTCLVTTLKLRSSQRRPGVTPISVQSVMS